MKNCKRMAYIIFYTFVDNISIIAGKFIHRGLDTVLGEISGADLLSLDRWSINAQLSNDVGGGGWNPEVMSDADVSEDKASNKLPMNVLNNYYSIGIDAYIAYKFHQARDR